MLHWKLGFRVKYVPLNLKLKLTYHRTITNQQNFIWDKHKVSSLVISVTVTHKEGQSQSAGVTVVTQVRLCIIQVRNPTR